MRAGKIMGLIGGIWLLLEAIALLCIPSVSEHLFRISLAKMIIMIPLAIVGIIGAIIVSRSPKNAGILLLISGIGVIILLLVPPFPYISKIFVTLIMAILLITGGTILVRISMRH